MKRKGLGESQPEKAANYLSRHPLMTTYDPTPSRESALGRKWTLLRGVCQPAQGVVEGKGVGPCDFYRMTVLLALDKV